MASYQKRGNKWRVSVKVGELRDTKTCETKAKARDWANHREIELRSMQDGVSMTHTLGDVFKRYAREVSPTKRGARWEIVRLEKLQRDSIASIKLANLCTEDLQDWIDRSLHHIKASSVNRELHVISAALTIARKKWKWIKESPTKDLERPKDPPPRDRRITEDEIERICYCLNYDQGAIPTQVMHRVALAFLFAIETGMRAGEICQLSSESINGKVANLSRTKNGSTRKVPLSDYALDILDLLPTDKLFDLRTERISTHFRTARINAGIEDLTFHDSRHEAITRLASRMDVLDLARMVGHKDLKQLLVYYNKSAEDIAEQLAA